MDRGLSIQREDLDVCRAGVVYLMVDEMEKLEVG